MGLLQWRWLREPPPPPPAPPAFSSLYLGDVVATNSHLLLFAHRISTIINISLEVVNTLCPNIEYLRVPTLDTPTARISSCFNSIPAESPLLGLSPEAPLTGTHPWVESSRTIVGPKTGFWQQLIHYEYKLFSINSHRTISSLSGMKPDVYGNKVRVILLLGAQTSCGDILARNQGKANGRSSRSTPER
ncbi:PREDICTED: dual specificity protein phosphatase 18-like [Chlamydotis macqueenii]|uniref:dual specificity protein phosphatase 18-like n=1 Tax=Chlamydotis macqueenii TaxID=187382 RepID=UPI0005295E8B|nr:PREDICTED: dual specificity protein phosphatase 18-like [Chlamydotis macqueenii]